MILRSTHFTPEVLLSAPRRSAGVPDPLGSRVVYTTSTHDFDSHKTNSAFKVLYSWDGETRTLSTQEGMSEINWLGGINYEDKGEILFLTPGEKKGTTSVKIASVPGKSPITEESEEEMIGAFEKSTYIAGEINASASNVRLVELGDERYGFVCAAPASPSGELYNPEDAPEIHTTGRLYDSMFVRHWDTWNTSNRSSLWYGVLQKKDSKWELSTLTNALQGTHLECPIPPFGGIDHFDVSRYGIIFASKDPELNEAFNSKVNVYTLRIHSFVNSSPPKPQVLEIPGYEGAKTSPVFSGDGNSVAFLTMQENGYEADQNHIYIHSNIWGNYPESFSTADCKPSWDRSFSSIFWSAYGDTLFGIAEDQGQACLWAIAHANHPENIKMPPQLLMRQGSVSSARIMRSGGIFVTATSLVDNSAWFIVSPGAVPRIRPISSNSRNGSSFGLSPNQVSSWTYPGKNQDIQAWVVKPSFFNENETYPLAYLIHGGPQGAWLNSWSTRWNPAVFAEQGYVVVCPNPTGSTGFGQAFTDAIAENWGGAPYDDLVAGVDAIEKNMPFVDKSRMVALGASYGGYMINWIQGNPLGRRFQALVCHDGVFSMPGAQLATDEQYFAEHDFGGKWEDNPEGWLKWNPAGKVAHWATPQLVIHSAKDYRLCISEGLAAFAALQSRGVKSQFLTYPDENHWVLRPENSLLWHAAVLDWINEAVGLQKYSENPKAKEVVQQAREGTGKVVKK